MQETAEKEAQALFEKSRKMGDGTVINASNSELKNQLDEKVYCVLLHGS